MVGFKSSILAGLALAGSAFGRDCTGIKAIHPECSIEDPTISSRDFFYVGGRQIPAATGGFLTADKLYVEKITPKERKQEKPIVFFHGGGCTATTWLNTPDNRRGFASYFLEQGFTVYLVDAPGNGRSTNQDLEGFPMTAGSSSLLVEAGFSNPSGYPQAELHTQFPGTGSIGDPTFEQFKNAMVPYSTNNITYEYAMRAGGCELLSLIGESYILGHSAGGSSNILLANDCPELIAGNINLEGSSIPFFWYTYGTGGFFSNQYGLSNTPIDYDPPIKDASELKRVEVGAPSTVAKRSCWRQEEPARQLPKIASVPYLMITGEASVHITYDHCIIEYLEQVGGKPEWIKLEDRGILGNGHFMHLEKNNDEIADVVLRWIRRRECKSRKAKRALAAQ